MSLAEIENKVLQLSEEERRQFVSWFYDHEAEIVLDTNHLVEVGYRSVASSHARLFLNIQACVPYAIV